MSTSIERRDLRVEGEITMYPYNGLQSDISIGAPSNIDERRKFIASLREWADALQTEVNERQRRLDEIQRQIEAQRTPPGATNG